MGLLSKIFGNTRKPEGFFGRLMVAGMNGGSHVPGRRLLRLPFRAAQERGEMGTDKKYLNMERPNYKNWMPKGMIWSFAAACAVCLVLTLVIRLNWLRIVFLIATIVLACVTLWTLLMHRTFSYDGKRQMSRQIIEGVVAYVNLPEGGRVLDVGCGSGALAIAVAGRNPEATVTGIDRWGADTLPSASHSARRMPVLKE